MPVQPVGIDAMYVYTPGYFVDTKELAQAREKDPAHFTEGVGIGAFSVPPPNETPVTMAATAAYRLLKQENVQPEEIFQVDVATESSSEGSRAMVSDVIGILEEQGGFGNGSFAHVIGHEKKFACVSGVEGLLDAGAWLASGWNRGKKVLLLVTDIARYELESPEEPTQGAAAAAILMSTDPRMLELVPGVYGSAMRNVRSDFHKQNARPIALVDGTQSVAAYLSEMRGAWIRFAKAAADIGFIVPEKGKCVSDYIERGIFHNPHRKMVQAAYASLLIREWDMLSRWQPIEGKIATPPEKGGMSDPEFYSSKGYKEYRRKFMQTPEFQQDFARRIAPSTEAPYLIGNSYAASVFAGIDSLFETDPKDLTGKSVALCGYGSGSHALIQAVRVSQHHREAKSSLDLMERLKKREKLDIHRYAGWHRAYEPVQRGELPLSKLGVLEPNLQARPAFVLTGVGTPGSQTERVNEYAMVA